MLSFRAYLYFTFCITKNQEGIDAFAIGVKSVNPDETIYVIVTNNWYDSEREEKTSRKDMGCDVIWNWSAYYIFTLGAVMKETRNSEKKTNELEQTRNKMIRLVTALSEIAKSTADITRIEYAKFYIAKDEPTRHIQDNHGISEYGKPFLAHAKIKLQQLCACKPAQYTKRFYFILRRNDNL